MDDEAAEIARRLRLSVRDLCRKLLDGGREESGNWVALCPWRHDRNLGSFKVRLTGHHAGWWKDFATAESGDMLDFIKRTRCHGSFADALDWSRDYLGMPKRRKAGGAAAEPAASPPPAEPPPAVAAAEEAAKAEERRKRAVAIYLGAQRELRGTAVDGYLQARGIHLSALVRLPGAIRFAPSLWNAESAQHWPAMVACIVDHTGAQISVHRTWLCRGEDGRWRKAPLQTPKMSYGPVAGGLVSIARGATGRPLAKAVEGEEAVIAEGLEDALAVAVACPRLRVICAVSFSNMSRLVLPPAISRVVIAADNDPPGSPAERGLRRAVDHFAGERRTVRVARSPVGKDFADCIAAGEPFLTPAPEAVP